MTSPRPTTERVTPHATAEGGFTLVELIVVMVVLAMLLALGLGNFGGLRERSADATARGNVRAAVPAVHAYHSDHGTYAGMADADLLAAEPTLKVTVVGPQTASSYCIRNTDPPSPLYYKHGPKGDITTTPCTGG
jgi:prepilin-type N-terminal cleavage/methylation domain-containing protein